MKKVITALLCVVLAVSFVGCGPKSESAENIETGESAILFIDKYLDGEGGADETMGILDMLADDVVDEDGQYGMLLRTWISLAATDIFLADNSGVLECRNEIAGIVGSDKRK